MGVFSKWKWQAAEQNLHLKITRIWHYLWRKNIRQRQPCRVATKWWCCVCRSIDEMRRGEGVGRGRRGGYGCWHNVLVRQCTTVNPAAKKKNCGYCPFSFVHLPLLWSCAVPIQCLVRFIKVQLYSRVNITFAHVPSGLAPNLQYKTSSLYGHLDSILPFWTLLPTTNRPVTGSRSAAAHNLWLSYMSLSCFMYFTTYQTL